MTVTTFEEKGIVIHSASVEELRYELEESDPTPTIAVTDLKVGDFVLREWPDGDFIAYNIVEVERQVIDNELGRFDTVRFRAERGGNAWVQRYDASEVIPGKAA